MGHKARTGATWLPMLGVGTKVPVSPNSLPQPDVYVQEGRATDEPVTDDAIVILEVLSRSSRKSDRAWRERVCAGVSNCQHYVTVSLRSIEVTAFDRSTGWKARRVKHRDQALQLPALALARPLDDIYRYVGVPAQVERGKRATAAKTDVE